MTSIDFQRALNLIQMEYVEMPELKLTLRQAARLWALRAEACQQALDFLIAGGFLVRTRDGAYVRRGTPPVDVEMFGAPPRLSA